MNVDLKPYLRITTVEPLKRRHLYKNPQRNPRPIAPSFARPFIWKQSNKCHDNDVRSNVAFLTFADVNIVLRGPMDLLFDEIMSVIRPGQLWYYITVCWFLNILYQVLISILTWIIQKLISLINLMNAKVWMDAWMGLD